MFENILRMLFQVACLLYKVGNSASTNNLLNSSVDCLIIILFLMVWAIQLFLAVVFFIIEFRHMITISVKGKTEPKNPPLKAKAKRKIKTLQSLRRIK